MKIIRVFTVLFVLMATLSPISLEGVQNILPVDQIKAGMKGKGRSVFLGDTIEEFDVEVLGVMRNIQPKKDLIVVRISGPSIEDAGVIQGMSGSPVYIEGKLIGALSYSLGAFVKEPLALVTPINEMKAIPDKEPTKSTFTPQIPIKKHLPLSELFAIYESYFYKDPTIISGDRTFAPISIPLVFSGFSPRVFDRAKDFFSRLGFAPMSVSMSGRTQEEIEIPDLTLRGGDSVGAQLVTGDLNVSGVGTVTYVEGNKVLAWGHPWFNLGTVEYMMTKTDVMTIVPKLDVSHKLTGIEIPVGKFSQDRMPGLYGELGQVPDLIPLNITMRTNKGERKYTVNIIDDKILTPALVNMVISSLVLSEERAIGDLSLEFSGDVYLDNGMSVHLEDLFSGNFDMASTNLSSLVAAVVFFLMSNEFQDLSIHRIDLAVSPSEDVKYAQLEKVWLDKYDASPGEIIRIKVYTRSFRGESAVWEGGIPVPNLPKGSEFYLAIADAVSLQQLEATQYKRQPFAPRNIEHVIRMLNNLRKNNRIYFKILASKPGLFLRGEEMPNLPPSMKSMFASPRAASSAPTELERSTLGQLQQPVPFVFRGATLIPIKIK
ncbi:MAG: SpoIVB peptidase S55 domain-containing protein [Candidatus Aminicenantes bacterium]